MGTNLKIICDSEEPLRPTRIVARDGGVEVARGAFCHDEFLLGVVLMAVILIVEDEVFIRLNAEWLIEDLGHHTLLASDVAGALVHLSASRHIDALFVDIRLSALGCGGYDVANQAVELRPGLRVLYTSGKPLTADMTELFVGGGQFIQKPYSQSQLEFSVGELLH
jgi:DNA-binding NtrC family response regulator